MSNNCAEKTRRAVTAFAADFWSKTAAAYNDCGIDQRPQAKEEIIKILDRIKFLLDSETNKKDV